MRIMVLLENKKAKLRFFTVESYSAGIELTGSEAKSLRQKQGSLDGARVVVRGGEAYLIGATIPPYQVANAGKGYDPERPRKLLLKKEEVAELADAESKKGLTIVPFEVYNDRYLKVRVAVVRGKGKADKREDLKKKDAEREVARILKRK
ncbi:MAG TPA: SsrA-binding protein SmpB [Candidatus Paceibacterota bacterium]|nr:SsrA-binding protein SmpB [Candidatus Paceibacterota bacterium]